MEEVGEVLGEGRKWVPNDVCGGVRGDDHGDQHNDNSSMGHPQERLHLFLFQLFLTLQCSSSHFENHLSLDQSRLV